jgi:hypothetical protein
MPGNGSVEIGPAVGFKRKAAEIRLGRLFQHDKVWMTSKTAQVSASAQDIGNMKSKSCAKVTPPGKS